MCNVVEEILGSSLDFAIISFVFLDKSQKSKTGKILIRSDLLLGSILLFHKMEIIVSNPFEHT